MEITSNYKMIDHTAATSETSAASAQQASPSSPTYYQLQQQAASLLNNPEVPASQKSKILALLSEAEATATKGAAGMLRQLSVELGKLDPGAAATANSENEDSAKPQNPLNPEDQVQISSQDKTDETNESAATFSATSPNQVASATGDSDDEKDDKQTPTSRDGTQAAAKPENNDANGGFRIARYDEQGHLITEVPTTGVALYTNEQTAELTLVPQSQIDTVA